jgi:hypothetical protein
MKLNLKKIQEHKSLLENHSLLVTNTIQSIEDLKIFMENHVFAVWDFMSLTKNLQHSIVPSGVVWVPTDENRSDAARLINEIILCEETDVSVDGRSYMSHFDLYKMAMLEIGADTTRIDNFIEEVKRHGYPEFLNLLYDEKLWPAIDFVKSTFSAIENGPHCVAASFCYGRETILPNVFRRIIRQLNINSLDAPSFHYYLDRHIEIDGDDHGPGAEKIVEILCKNDPILIHEAENSAIEAIQARINFFNAIENML